MGLEEELALGCPWVMRPVPMMGPVPGRWTGIVVCEGCGDRPLLVDLVTNSFTFDLLATHQNKHYHMSIPIHVKILKLDDQQELRAKKKKKKNSKKKKIPWASIILNSLLI